MEKTMPNLIDLIENSVSQIEGVRNLNSKRNIVLRWIPGYNYLKNPAIKVSEDEQGLKIEINIIVFYGSNIPELCFEIQQRIKNNVENKFKTKISSIDITVDGVVER